MASTILLKRSNTAGNDAYTGTLGEVTIDTQARKLRIHDGVKVGGFTVANMSDVQAVIDQVNALTIDDIGGLRAALNAIEADVADHETRLTTVETNYIKKDGTVAFTGNVDAGTNKIINVGTPTLNTDAANKSYVDTEISSLGNVFSYIGSITAGTQATPLDLSTLSDTTAGSYYSVDGAGYVTYSTVTEYVNVNDAVLFDASGGYKVIDNTNSEISGTLDYVDVSGGPDTGYTVDLSTTFKNRVSSLESGTVSGVTGTAPITVDNVDPQNPVIDINNVTTTTDGAMIAADKVKLDGIESGAQVNTVTSVAGKTGAVSLVKVDVGLGNVNNYDMATQAEAEAGTSLVKYMSPQRTRDFIENGTYTVDGGSF